MARRFSSPSPGSVRFNERGVRRVKDRMNREILGGLDEAGIGVASGTCEIVGLPPVRVATEKAPS